MHCFIECIFEKYIYDDFIYDQQMFSHVKLLIIVKNI